MKYNFIKIILIISLFFGVVIGQSVDLNGQKIDISQNEIVLEISGLVCSFCAMGLQNKLSKLDHLDKSKYNNGVFIDVKHQYAIIAESENENVGLDEVVKLTTEAGYDVKTIYTNPVGDKIKVKEFGEEK